MNSKEPRAPADGSPELAPPDVEAFASPRLFPLTLDPTHNEVRLVGLREPQYRAASFLDERILAEAGPGVVAPFSVLEAAARTLAGESDFIFHIGHVGSTLLSRLLGGDPKVFSLREPAILRTLASLYAQGSPDALTKLGIFARLWARTWRAEQKVLLKATSFTNDLAPFLMEEALSSRAILMFVPPADYMAGILAGEGTRREMMALAPSRLTRLHRRLGAPAWRLEDMDEGAVAAMSWACEITALADLALRFPGRCLWFDFEDHLALPAAGLSAALRHLHGAALEPAVAALLASPDVGRYSKAPEFAYDASLRRRTLAEAKDRHRLAIARGGAWLNAAGRAHRPIVEAAAAAAKAPRIG